MKIYKELIGLSEKELKLLLEKKYRQYNNPEFISTDPISVPHKYYRKQDIEIAGFITSVISWGQRVTIIRNAEKITEIMSDSPYNFIINAVESDFDMFKNVVHRTFNGDDCAYFMKALQKLYREYPDMEAVFVEGLDKTGHIMDAISFFRNIFFELPHNKLSERHISNPEANSAAKRMNMFLRWMVRKDNNGVDFGIWKQINPAVLMCPLDVHSAKTARQLGLLVRRQNDRKAVEELTAVLRHFDPDDPVKYDFALFGLGVTKNLQEVL